MSIKVDISVGEFLDKLTILQIKAERIGDAGKLHNIRQELQTLDAIWSASAYTGTAGLDEDVRALRQVNEQLWDIEDAIRECERAGEFGEEFIRLARSVYISNDRRAEIKRIINGKTGSALMEEKSYADYRPAD